MDDIYHYYWHLLSKANSNKLVTSARMACTIDTSKTKLLSFNHHKKKHICTLSTWIILEQIKWCGYIELIGRYVANKFGSLTGLFFFHCDPSRLYINASLIRVFYIGDIPVLVLCYKFQVY